MALPETAVERLEYRLILVKSGSEMIWVERNGDGLRLPRIVIDRWTRQAEKLQQAIAAAWLLRVVVLDILPGRDGAAGCTAVEILSPDSPLGLTFASISEISANELREEEREMVRGIVSRKTGARGPFARVGWVDEAMEWLHSALGHNVQLTGEIRQYNAGGGFALIRFATQSGPAYWLKATGGSNVHEFQVTAMLAEMCPEALPRRLAARADWNAWVMEDAGQPLGSWSSLALEQAVSSMATLQQKTIGRSKELQAAGAFDLSSATLRAHLPELFEYLEAAMAKQTSVEVERIQKSRLWEMAGLLEDACYRMEDLGIPDTVVHNDMNPSNILFDNRRCVFTDWCEAGVGNPFLTFQHLCVLQTDIGADWNRRLREIYKQRWIDIHLSADQIEQVFTLIPPLAILSYLYGRGTWLRSSRRSDLHFEKHARSLARHMDRALQECRSTQVVCH